MKGKLKVKIIVPFIDGQKKGDINYMSIKAANNYEKEGLIKIINDESNKQTFTKPIPSPTTPPHTTPHELTPEQHIKFFFKENIIHQVEQSKETLFIIKNNKTKILQHKSKSGLYDELVLKFDILMDKENLSFNFFKDWITPKLDLDESQENSMTIKKFLQYYMSYASQIKLIYNQTFKPISEPYILKEGNLYLNSFVPTEYLKTDYNNGCKDKNTFSHIRDLLMNLCNNQNNDYDYLLKVLSHSIKNPCTKRHGYLLLKGDGASGKGTFFDLVMTPIFGKYFISGSYEETLGSDFNSHISDTIWLVIEEKEKDKSKLSNINSILKNATGGGKIIRKQKFLDSSIEDNHTNYIITTNKTNPGLELDSNDRRLSVLGHSETLGGSFNNASKKRTIYETEIPKELENFVSYLKNLDFEYTEVFQPLINEEREKLILLDSSNAQKFVFYIKTLSINEIKEHFKIIHQKKDNIYMSSLDLYSYFKDWCLENDLHKTNQQNFFAEFYQSTKIKTSRVRFPKDDKQLTCINYKDLLKISKYYKEVQINE